MSKVAVDKTKNLKELSRLRDSMKTKIVKFDQLTQELEKIHAELEGKRALMDGTKKIEKIKKATKDLKLEIWKLDQRIGVVKAILKEGKKEEEEPQHHLYDDLYEL